jgi:hypothetical protein
MSELFRMPKIARRPKGVPTTNVTNELADALNNTGPGRGWSVDPQGQVWTFSFLALIWDAGPNGEGDYSDSRYWVKPQLAASADYTDEIALDDDGGLLPETIVTATNLAEANKGFAGKKHLLAKNSLVRAFFDADPDGLAHYSFECNPARTVCVTLTQTGGSDGTGTAPATYTYDAADVDNPAITWAGLSPQFQRPNGKTKPATSGLLKINPHVGVVLWITDECPATKVCA